jgi:putative zinc finger/helix-turn-helix YgiT family protein
MESQAMKCLLCSGKMTTKRENYRYAACGLPNVTLVGVDVRRCATCGEHEIVIPRIEELHRVLAAAIVRRTSRLTSHEIRFLRKYLGYSGVDFARIVGVSAETVSRWENGKETMRRSAENLVRMLVVHQQPIRQYAVDTLARIGRRRAPKAIGVRMKGETWVEQDLKAA